MEQNELKRQNSSNVVLVTKSENLILKDNTNVFVETEDSAVLVENKELQTRVTLVEDFVEGMRLVSEDNPLRAALSVTEYDSHIYSDHACVFNKEKLARIIEISGVDSIVYIIKIVDENVSIFAGNQENADRFLDCLLVIGKIYYLEYALNLLSNADIGEFLNNFDNPISFFEKKVLRAIG